MLLPFPSLPCHGRRFPHQHAGIKWLRNNVFRPETNPLHAPYAWHTESGTSSFASAASATGRRQFHLFVDSGSLYVQRTSEIRMEIRVRYSPDSENPTSRDYNYIFAGRLRFFIGNFRVRICHREHNGPRRHRSAAFPRVNAPLHCPRKHPPPSHRLRSTRRFGLRANLALYGFMPSSAALVHYALGVGHQMFSRFTPSRT